MLRRSFLLGWGALAVPANAHSFDRRELELLNDGESNLCPICDLMVVSERQARGVLHFTPKRTWDWRLRVDAASGGFHVLAPEGGGGESGSDLDRRAAPEQEPRASVCPIRPVWLDARNANDPSCRQSSGQSHVD
jgi:hypothetical protein